VELPLSLLAPPTAGPSNTASTSTAPAASSVPVVPVKKDTKKKHHLTTATDPLFAELRDLNFSSVGKKLNKVARRLDEDYKVSLLYNVFSGRLYSLQRRTFKRRPLLNYATSLGNLGGSKLSTKPFDSVSSQFPNAVMPFNFGIDTGLSELIVPLTRTEIFNKSLEIQQSKASRVPFHGRLY
jgi:hypothetical protein